MPSSAAEWGEAGLGSLHCQTLRIGKASLFWATPDPGLPALAPELLSQAEQVRAAHFRRNEDRLSYIAAHALKRLAIGRLLNREPRTLEFVDGPGGKPALRDGEAQFNLSHTSGAVALALCVHAPVGVDVERVRPGQFDAMVEREGFHPAELAQLADLDRPDRTSALWTLWTLREAVAKATGAGLASSPDSFRVDLASLRLVEPPPHFGPGEGWRLHAWRPAEDLALALALPPG